MGSYKTILQRHLSPHGPQHKRFCCGAAPTRSPVTAYTEVSARSQLSLPASRLPYHDHGTRHQSQQILCQPEQLTHNGDATGRRTSDDASSGTAGGAALLEADTMIDHHAAAVLLPPVPISADAEVHDLPFFQPSDQGVAVPLLQLPDQGQRQGPHHHHFLHQHQRQQCRHQPRQDHSQGSGYDTPLLNSSTVLSPGQGPPHPALTCSVPQSLLPAVLGPQVPRPQEDTPGVLEGCSFTPSGESPTYLSPTYLSPNYLDAVSRSLGEASTSERSGSPAHRLRSAAQRSEGSSLKPNKSEGSHALGRAHGRSRNTASRDLEASRRGAPAEAAFSGSGPSTGESGSEHYGRLSGGLLVGVNGSHGKNTNNSLGSSDCEESSDCEGRLRETSSSSNDSSSDTSSNSTDDRDAGGARGFENKAPSSGAVRNHAGAWDASALSLYCVDLPVTHGAQEETWAGSGSLPPGHPEADAQPPTSLSLPPEGELHSGAAAAAAAHPSQPSRSGSARNCKAATAAGVPATAPVGWRRPRAPTRREHELLRHRAALQRQALVPREPTLEDLRLTTRVMSAVHWRDLVAIVTEHRVSFERRAAVTGGAGAGTCELGPHGKGQEGAAEVWSHVEPEEAQCQGRDQASPGPASSLHSTLQRPLQQGLVAEQQQQQRRHRQRQPHQQHANPHLRASHLTPPTPAGAPQHEPAGGTGGPLGVLAPAPSAGVPVSALPYTPQHVAAILMRLWQLLFHSSRGPRSRAEAGQLRALVECMVRMTELMMDSPGVGMREIVTIFYALVRLGHPVGRPFYIELMNAARRRFKVRSAPPPAGPEKSKRHGQLSGPAAAAAKAASATVDVDATAAEPPPLPYNAQDMAMLLWSVSACGVSSLRADWAAEYGSALVRVIPELTAQGVSVVLYSMARLRSPPRRELLAALCSRLAGLLRRQPAVYGSEFYGTGACAACTAVRQVEPSAGLPGPENALGPSHRKEVANLAVHAAACTPPEPCASSHAVGGGCGCVESSRTLPSSGNPSSVYHPHNQGPLLQPPSCSNSSSSSGNSCYCRPADVSMSLWALATLRLAPSSVCTELLPAAEHYSLHRLADFPQQELSNLVWAMARLQYTPGHAWVQGLYDTVEPLLDDLRPQALATLLYSLSQMGQRPREGWLRAVAARAREQLHGFSPQALALTLHALASMGFLPEAAWLHDFHSQLEFHSSRLDNRVRDKVREAYRMLGFRPGYAMRRAGAVTTAVSTATGKANATAVMATAATAFATRPTAGGGSGGAGSSDDHKCGRPAPAGVIATGPSCWLSRTQHQHRTDIAAESEQHQESGQEGQGLGQGLERGSSQARPSRRNARGGSAAGGGGLPGFEAGAAGTAEEAEVQVLVRPSRFGF